MTTFPPQDLTAVPPLRARIQAAIDQIEVRHFGYPVRFVLTAPTVFPVGVSLIGTAPHRDHGGSIDVLIPRDVSGLAAAGDSEIAVFLWQLLRDFAAHEVDEAFHFQGRRVFDPHDQRRSPTY